MYAELITIGDEILIGQIVDSNSAWMAQQLNEIGIEVKQISSISDQITDIQTALSLASTRADIILMTGGLGPTQDDVTREALAGYFHSGLHRDERVLAHVKALISASNQAVLEVNNKQADVLDIAEVLFNKAGTAPGMYIQDKGKHFFVMPGVPSEMKYLVAEEVIPRLRRFPSPNVLVHRSILTAGIGESFLAFKIAAIESSLPESVQLAYLPAFGEVRLRLSGKGKNKAELEEKINFYADLIKKEVGEYCFGEGNTTFEEALIQTLAEHQLTLGTAESCTGGNIAHLLTLVPGSSEAFKGGVVAYTNEVKEQFLGVPQETLKRYGAVSEETVRAMAEGVKQRMKTDYAIATTGIAGPAGGSVDHPVGTVWIGVAGKNKTIAQRFSFDAIRSRTIDRSSKHALISLFKIIKEESKG